jgi:hypothetical protein
MPTSLPDAAAVTALHDSLLRMATWPANEPAPRDDGLWRWIQTNHRFNCLLWAEEDLARRTQVGDDQIAANKRAIDRYNQARNDATERVDELLLIVLGLVDPASARTDAPVATAKPGSRLNSETAGSMIDRLSILALKVHAIERLQQQRSDLGACLDALLADAQAGRAHFKVYRQFKMYNDPRFNPALVSEQKQR